MKEEHSEERLALTLAVDQPSGVGHALFRNEYLPAEIGHRK
jgi:hypothetical protein